MGVTVEAVKKTKQRLFKEFVPVVPATRKPSGKGKILPRVVSPLPYTAKNNTTPLTESQRELAASPAALNLAQRMATIQTAKWPSLAEDWLSVAYVALCEAARTFDPTKGIAFTTHAGHRINGAFLDVGRLQKIKGYRKRGEQTNVPTVGYLGYHHEERSDLDREPALATHDDVADVDSFDDVYQLTRNLPTQERRVLRMLFTRANCQGYPGIARELGVHPSRVGQIVASAIRTLREQMGSTCTLDIRGGRH